MTNLPKNPVRAAVLRALNGQHAAVPALEVPRIVRYDFVILASLVGRGITIGAQVPVPDETGQPVTIPMPDFAKCEAQFREVLAKAHADGTPWTDDETDRLACVALVAEMQARYAAIVGRFEARHTAPTPE